MGNQQLRKMWLLYGNEKHFNYTTIQDRIEEHHPIIKFKANEQIVMRGIFQNLSISFVVVLLKAFENTKMAVSMIIFSWTKLMAA